MKEEIVDVYKGFNGGNWQENVDVADFIKQNYKEYKGDDNFLAPISPKTKKVWEKCEKLLQKEANFTPISTMGSTSF